MRERSRREAAREGSVGETSLIPVNLCCALCNFDAPPESMQQQVKQATRQM